MDLRRHMPWLCFELFFLMLCMCCTHKGSSLNLDLMISGNYIMIMIMLMFIYACMYVCMYVVFDRANMDNDFFYANGYMRICICVCCYLTGSSGIMNVLCWCLYVYMYVCMSLFDRVTRDHSRGGMIAYVGEWHEKVPSSWGIKWEE